MATAQANLSSTRNVEMIDSLTAIHVEQTKAGRQPTKKRPEHTRRHGQIGNCPASQCQAQRRDSQANAANQSQQDSGRLHDH